MTLATIGACGRQHKGVVSLVFAGPTPGPVVRRQERLRHSIGRGGPADHEALSHTSEAAAAARLIRTADVRSETAEQEDGAIHKVLPRHERSPRR